MKFRVLVEPDEDGVFVAECPSLPGCVSQGATRGDALENIQDAIKGYLESWVGVTPAFRELAPSEPVEARFEPRTRLQLRP